ncbi:MAG TPA: CAP domain-containing protein [Acidimicrobiia bacterium]|nr:CAP domain-containing protein [Acidimicrobiia bacterium]
MTRNRFFAFVAVAALSTAAAAMIWSGRQSPDPVAIESLRTAVPTTSGPDTTAMVFDMTAITLEEALIREAAAEATEASTTTTLPPSTTTTAGPTTTAPDAPATTSGSSPTTTAAPSPTTTAATTPPSTIETGYVSSAESEFANRIASYRSANGEDALTRDGSLDSYARSWAKAMAESGQLSHSNVASLMPPWKAAGENVGMGGSVGGIFDALASSSGHRTNMLSDFSNLGVGVYRAADGALWTAHVFTR